MTTREQKRVVLAIARLGDVDASLRADYVSLAKSLPVLLHTNGLLQTAAFFQAKGAAHATMLAHLESFLRDTHFLGAEDQLTRKAAEVSYPIYLRMQQEAIACATWLKRLSVAAFGDDGHGGALQPGPEAR